MSFVKDILSYVVFFHAVNNSLIYLKVKWLTFRFLMTSLKYNEREYEACDWFLNIQTQRSVSELQSDLFVSNSGFLVDNRTQRFIERYFNAFYLVDVGGEFENDICILRHSNTLCVVGLACGHHIFKRCSKNSSSDCSSSVTHEILGLDYQVSNGLNRSKKNVKGRRKHGGHVLNKSTDIIAYAICDREINHPVVCGIPGNLLEVNNSLDITKTEFHPPISEDLGYLNSKVKLTPLIGSESTINVGTYLSIILPKPRPRKDQSGCIIDKSIDESILLIDSPTQNCTALVGDVSEKLDDLTQSDYVAQIADFISQTSLPKEQKVLNWNEYSALRHCT
ncbi:unnamed protein product [Schistosoma curassoni]|nr:unnamed protein product [Schistosoma curassoni]